MRANEFIVEAFNQPYPITWEQGDYDSYDALAKLDDGSNLSINFNLESGGPEGMDKEWHVEFWRNNSLAVTGEGDAYKIFATVLVAIQQFIEQEHPDRIAFSASKDVEPGQNVQSRSKLYDRMVQRYAASWGYTVARHESGDKVTYELTRRDSVEEDKESRQQLDFNKIYGKYLKVTDNNGNPRNPGFSLVTPLNGDSWNWRERPEFKELVRQKLNDPGFLGDHKYQQIIDAMAGKEFDPARHLYKENFADGKQNESLDEGLRDWIAALAATGAIAMGSPVDAKTAPVQQTQSVEQVSQVLAKPVAQVLKKVAVASGITGTELAQFMAQCAHETANFTTMKEHGGSLDFKKYDPKYAPKKAKALGNVQVGDGARYHGRGYIQLTGRDNYKRAGQALGLPLEQQPELVERPDVAAKVAVWFWKSRVQPKVTNYHDTRQVTKPINPGLRGLADRQAKVNAIKQGAMARPGQIAPRGTRT